MTDSKKTNNELLNTDGYQPMMEGYQPRISGEHLAINGYQPQNHGSAGFFNSPITMQQQSSLPEPEKHGYQPPSQTRPVAPPPQKP
ncbi:hypothetical protein FHC49_00295 [Kluyvera sp. EC_51]|uniref:hypothetical protein n=1 Tax=Kluyvera sp. EC_51 TaxID=2584089 RepID=UPI001C708163|nr:hypothetical protein [Kluyvera sp. EC_51]EKI2959915.1 hypothetical protein [Escherichia coli]MBW9459866.1 hypothetical protein [Kluyvera sp. EC_51]HAX1721743.1 hypothetical protein [Escherichia coli]